MRAVGESLFENAKKFITNCCDTVTKDEQDNVVSRSTTIVLNESESVSFEYGELTGVIYFNVNNEPLLEITKDSPILEAFEELLYQIGD